MTAYESIKDKLSPLTIYSIQPDGLMEAELRAYAAGLQELYDAVDNMLREMFIQTAENEGLTNPELMASLYTGGNNIAERRERLLKRLSVKPTDIGTDGLKNAVASLGIECNISDSPNVSWVNIDVLTPVDESKRESVAAEIEKFVPCHLVPMISFNGE